MLELRTQILEADFLQSAICVTFHRAWISSWVKRENTGNAIYKDCPAWGNTQEKGKENGVLWSDIQQQSRRGPVQPWKPVPGTLAACPSSTPSLCLFHREIPVPSSTSSRRPPLFFSSLHFPLIFSSASPFPDLEPLPPALPLYLPSPEQREQPLKACFHTPPFEHRAPAKACEES